MPLSCACAKPRSTLAEPPLVDSPTAMSHSRPAAAIGRANTSSKPTSLASAVNVATSLVSDIAGSGRSALRGAQNRVASASASVLLPPLPKVIMRPPRAKRWAIAVAQAAIRSPSAASTSSRSLAISVSLSLVERATSDRTPLMSALPACRNG